MDKRVVLKDGIVVIRKYYVLHLNKNRRYCIMVNGKKLANNLLYSELNNYIKVARNCSAN